MAKKSLKHKQRLKSHKKNTFFRKIKNGIFFSIFLVLKFFLLFFTILSIPLIYFTILVSVEPRSFKYLDQYIEREIVDLTSLQIAQFKSNVSFNYSKGGFLVNLNDIKLKSENNNISFSNISFVLDFPKLFIGQVKISSALIKDPIVTIDFEKIKKQAGISESSELKNNLKIITNSVINFISTANFKIKNLSLDDGVVNIINNGIKGQSANNVTIYVDNADFKSWAVDGKKNISVKTNIGFDKNYRNINSTLKCYVDGQENLNCNLLSKDMNLSAFEKIASYNPNIFYYTKNIKGVFDISSNLNANKKDGILETELQVSSSKGNFNLDKFFNQTIDFSNLLGIIRTKNNFETFTIDTLKTDFGDTKFAMSMEVKPSEEEQYKDIYMSFNMNDIYIDDLDRLWPIFLGEHSRHYVINHIHNGIAPVSYANMFMKYDKQTKESRLVSIDSKVNFHGSEINYSDNFPNVTDIDGIAHFTKDKMSIEIKKGRVLGSIFSNGKVEIPDFNKQINDVVIEGNIQGEMRDIFDHIDYKAKSGNDFYNYINGYANSKIKIALQIKDDLTFSDALISVTSSTKNANTVNLLNDSEVSFSFLKKANSNNATIKINLTNAEVILPFIGFYEQKGVEKNLNAELIFDLTNRLIIADKLEIKGLDINMEASGEYDLAQKNIRTFNTENMVYENSNFNINYGDSVKTEEKYLIITGDSIDLSSKLSFKVQKSRDVVKEENKIDLDKIKRTNVLIQFGQVLLKEEKKLNNFRIDGYCKNFACQKLSINAQIDSENKNIYGNIKFDRVTKDNSIINDLEVKIDDVGYILKGLGATDSLIGGSFVIKATMQTGEFFVLDGTAVLQDKIEIKRSKKARILLNNEQEQDKEKLGVIENIIEMFTGNSRLEFSKAKIDFKLKNENLNIKELIANNDNLGLGLTATGDINIYTGKVDLTGLIIPMYKLNSLFGIGELPVVGSLVVGEKGGGLFAPTYYFKKKDSDDEGDFTISKASAIAPGISRNIFNFINIFDKNSFFRNLFNDNKEEKNKNRDAQMLIINDNSSDTNKGDNKK